MLRATSLWLALPLACGCYLAHGRDEGSGVDDPRGRRDASGRDAGAVSRDASPRIDAGPGPALDGGALPMEPEPDPDPDERPTGPWDDVPPPDEDEPALVSVGERVELDDATDTGGAPVLVWNGSGWGIAWEGRFRTLHADGTPASPTRTVPGTWPSGSSLDYAAGRYALILGGGTSTRLGAFDRVGTLAAGFEEGPAGDEVDVGRLEIAHEWIVGTNVGGDVAVFAADNAMRAVIDPIVIATGGEDDVRIAGAKSRAVVVWNTAPAVWAQVLRAPPLAPDGPPLRVMDVVSDSDSAVEVEVFRDLVAIAAMDGEQVYLSLLDAWLRAVVVPARVVGRSGITDRRPALAVAPEHGFFVVCWAEGRGPAGGSGNDGVSLQVVGADGALWGTPLALVTGESNVGGVDCGWNGTEIVVVWWRAAGDGAWNTIFSERARPTFL